jgi:hypothetical protein
VFGGCFPPRFDNLFSKPMSEFRKTYVSDL